MRPPVEPPNRDENRAAYIRRLADAILDGDDAFVSLSSESESQEAVNLIKAYLPKEEIQWTSPHFKVACASTKE